MELAQVTFRRWTPAIPTLLTPEALTGSCRARHLSQKDSGIISIAPHGHSSTQMPQPLQ